MKYLTSTLALGALLVFASPAFAATFRYVDTAGDLKVVIANNPTEAIATAPNIAANSGVWLVSGTSTPVVVTPTPTPTPTSGSNTYKYVDTQGTVRTVVAGSPTQAIATAPNIAANSGVLLVSN